MRRSLIVVMAAMLLALPGVAQGQEKQPSAADQYQALLKEYRKIRQPKQFAAKFMELAEKHADDPVAIDALGWVVMNLAKEPESQKAADVLAKKHLNEDKLATLCQTLGNSQSVPAENLMRAAIEKSKNEQVQVAAGVGLATMLKMQSMYIEMLKNQPKLRPQLEQYVGKQFVERIDGKTIKDLEAEREKLLDRVASADAGDLSKKAKAELFEIRHLSVGKAAPEIEGVDIDGVEFKLSNYRGKVVMLDFWGNW